MVMEATDQGHLYFEVCKHFNVPRSSLRGHMMEKTKSRKIGPTRMLSTNEEHAFCTYIDDMAKCRFFLTPTEVKIIVGQMTEVRNTSFKNGVLGPFWLRWFKNRHPKLILRTFQGL